MSELLIARVRNELEHEITSLETALRHLEALSYPTRAAPNFIAQLKDEVKQRRNSIKTSIRDYQDVPAKLLDLLVNAHREIGGLAAFLGYVERAQTSHVPWSFVESIESLAAVMVPGRPVLTCCVDEHNYTLCAFDERPQLLLLLPRLHRLNVLWHTIVGHEFFHVLLRDFFQTNLATATAKITSSCIQLLRDRPRELGRAGALQQLGLAAFRPDRLAQYCRDLWVRAMTEVLCDLGCACMFGPAAVMAIFSMGLSFNLDALPEPPSFHPPWRLRFRVVRNRVYADCVKALTALAADEGMRSYVDAFEETLADFDRLASDMNDQRLIRLDPVMKIAYDEVATWEDEGWAFIRKMTATWLTPWQNVTDHIEPLISRLSQGIPPSEIERGEREHLEHVPACLASILLAGWIYESSWLQERALKKRNQIDYKTLMRLLLKACEDSELRARYHERARKKRTR